MKHGANYAGQAGYEEKAVIDPPQLLMLVSDESSAGGCDDRKGTEYTRDDLKCFSGELLVFKCHQRTKYESREIGTCSEAIC